MGFLDHIYKVRPDKYRAVFTGLDLDATDEEIRVWKQAQADARLKGEAREREEYEKLRAKFEGGGSVAK